MMFNAQEYSQEQKRTENLHEEKVQITARPPFAALNREAYPPEPKSSKFGKTLPFPLMIPTSPYPSIPVSETLVACFCLLTDV